MIRGFGATGAGLLAIGLALGSAASCAGASRALIVGIDEYQPEGTTAQHPAGCGAGRCVLRQFENLAGAVNDAVAMAELLTSPKFGFPVGNVALLTNPARKGVRPGVVVLPAMQTSRDGILATMQRYLVDLPEKGDTVVFYAAGHGSLRVNLAGDKLTLRAAGNKLVHVDSTLVPADAYLGGYDVRDREMTRIFHAALDKGVHLTVIFDTCHSGGIARGEGGPRQRFLAYDPRPINDPPETLPNGQRRPPPSERTDDPALVFTAVQQDQSAQETEPDERLPEVHGAFTAALIETLQVLPANAPATEVYQAVRAKIEGAGIAAEDPDLDAGVARRKQPLFGDAAGGSDAGKVRAAVVGMEKDGSVLLDIGMVSGVGAGSEFTATVPNAAGERVKLRVREGLGIARSEAMVVSPAGSKTVAKVGVGEVFELTKLTAGVADPLRFWVGAANLSSAEVAAAVEEVKQSGIEIVADPVEEPYTDVLSWDGKAWIVRRALKPQAATAWEGDAAAGGEGTKLGARLCAAALKGAMPVGAKLWVDLPASREVAVELKLSDPNSGARAAGSVVNAQYVLAGSIRDGQVVYAWVHKAEVAAGPRTAAKSDHSPGCSTTSSYPARSDWTKARDVQDAVTVLHTDSLRLARVHGWLQLANDQVAGTAMRNFYKLAVVPVGDEGASSDGALREDSAMELALKADAQVANPLWVYVLDIDCHGQGTLLYPRDFSENQYPDQGDGQGGALQIKLRHSPTLKVGAPYGVDTMILLGTAQPLPDPTVLDFEGVSRPTARGSVSPLEELFAKTSRGMRGAGSDGDGEIPMGWTIQTLTLRTVPKSAAQ